MVLVMIIRTIRAHLISQSYGEYMKKNMKTFGIAVLSASLVLSGCATNAQGEKGGLNINKTVIGAVAGALGGAAISKATGGEKTGRDAAIGAAIGAAAGVYMERQAKQIETQMQGTGVEVKHDEKTGNIDLVMPSDITFAFDDSSLNPAFMPSLNQLAQTMKQYDKTTIVVAGHTDAVGSVEYNNRLSERRADSVRAYLVGQGVAAHRVQIVGYGKAMPLADNSTEAGRAKNRRVQITINAPESL